MVCCFYRDRLIKNICKRNVNWTFHCFIISTHWTFRTNLFHNVFLQREVSKNRCCPESEAGKESVRKSSKLFCLFNRDEVAGDEKMRDWSFFLIYFQIPFRSGRKVFREEFLENNSLRLSLILTPSSLLIQYLALDRVVDIQRRGRLRYFLFVHHFSLACASLRSLHIDSWSPGLLNLKIRTCIVFLFP